jgi:HSP20 family molecular chaperone IbpA
MAALAQGRRHGRQRAWHLGSRIGLDQLQRCAKDPAGTIIQNDQHGHGFARPPSPVQPLEPGNRGLFQQASHALKAGSGTPFLSYRLPILGAGQPLKGGLDVNRQTIFGSPYLLGFDHLERLLERTARTAGESYPPYNIEELEDDGIRITLAVAGFSQEELSVTEEDRQLVVRGRQADANGKTFLHRGIAARQFLRSFVLADGIEVTAAALANGLLKIDLARKQVQPSTRVIDIRTGG